MNNVPNCCVYEIKSETIYLFNLYKWFNVPNNLF
jgi:hypothetical protein